MQRPNFMSRFAATLASRQADDLPGATVTSFEDLGNGIARVVVAHSFDAGQAKNREALNNALDGKATVIAGSFRPLPVRAIGTDRLVSSGYVRAAEVIEPLTAERESKMTAMAKNVLMDAADSSVWDITESNGDRFIRRQTSEDISAVLASVTKVKLDMPQVTALAFASPSARSYVSYVDPNTQQLSFGYVVATAGEDLSILPRDGQELVSVSRALVVAMVYDVDTKDNFLKNSLDKLEAATAAAAKKNKALASLPDKEKMKEYFRKVYYYDPEYLNLVEQTIDKQASL